MAPKGTYSESDPSEVGDFLDRKVLKGALGRFFAKFDGAVILPASAGEAPKSMRKATEAGIPHASITKTKLSGSVHVHLWPPAGMTEDDVAQRVGAAGIGAPEPRKSFGQYLYEFGDDATGAQLVSFATKAVRAIGATPAGDQWIWWSSQPVDTG